MPLTQKEPLTSFPIRNLPLTFHIGIEAASTGQNWTTLTRAHKFVGWTTDSNRCQMHQVEVPISWDIFLRWIGTYLKNIDMFRFKELWFWVGESIYFPNEQAPKTWELNVRMLNDDSAFWILTPSFNLWDTRWSSKSDSKCLNNGFDSSPSPANFYQNGWAETYCIWM